MKGRGIAKRYARALFQAAHERGCSETIRDELTHLGGVLSQEPSLRSFLESPVIGKGEKKELLTSLWRELHPLTQNFLRVVVDSRRQDDLLAMISEYAHVLSQNLGVVEAVVTVPFPLTMAQQDQLTQKLREMEQRTVRLCPETIDPSLIGGFVVQIEDRLYDGSLRTQLDRFRKSLQS
jgi:F-type H+-transporting ATPase subunit delta